MLRVLSADLERGFQRLAQLQQVEKPSAQTDCDVLVVGGGPAGATIAALLAERGRNVILVEKDPSSALPYRRIALAA